MTTDDLQQLFSSHRTAFFHDMERFAEEHHVPIMRLEGIDAFLQLLRVQQARTILEVGSAIGYSALRMASLHPEVHVSTIERDDERFKTACSYIQASEHAAQVRIFHADALEFDVETLPYEQYDALFIDAAKGQYQLFFDRYAPLVKPGGVIYSDNIFLNGLTQVPINQVPRRKRTMVRKLHAFTQQLQQNEQYDSYFFPLGDGLLVSTKR